jgi:hypothetical protein
MSERELGIHRNRLLERREAPAVVRGGVRFVVGSEQRLVSSEALRGPRTHSEPSAERLMEVDGDRLGDFVLNRKDVRQLTVVALRQT